MMRIIQIIKWYLFWGKKHQMVRDAPVYAVLGEDKFDVLPALGGPAFEKRAKKKRDELGRPSSGWIWQLADEDEWEEIPEDQWPDEVCAAIAKTALVGEGED